MFPKGSASPSCRSLRCFLGAPRAVQQEVVVHPQRSQRVISMEREVIFEKKIEKPARSIRVSHGRLKIEELTDELLGS